MTHRDAEGRHQSRPSRGVEIAAEYGQLDMIDQLLAASTPVDGVDKDGLTILHEAAFTGRADSVRHLLARGADPSRRRHQIR